MSPANGAKGPRVAGTAAAVAALLAGILVAIDVDGPLRPVTGPEARGGLVAQPSPSPSQGGPDAGCSDRNCDLRDNETETNPGQPGESGEGGQAGRCYFRQGTGGLRAAEPGQAPQVVLVAQQQDRVRVHCYLNGAFYLDGCYWGDPPTAELLPPADPGDDEIILAASQPTPPPGHEGEDGRWYYGNCLRSVVGQFPNESYVWHAFEYWRWFPDGTVPAVTPEQVVQDWLATVGLDGVDFRLAPPDTGAGVVNLPVWLGVDESSATTWGRISADQCWQGVCVAIEALVVSVEWDMGDGDVFPCTREQHEAWRPDLDYLQPGDYCHHYYHRASRDQPDGEYQITATSTWEVTWESQVSDATGTIEPAPTRTSTVGLQIDEIQVLTD